MTSPAPPHAPPDLITTDQIHEALKRWASPHAQDSQLPGLVLFRHAMAQAATPMDAQRQVLAQALGALAVEDETQARLLRLRFEQGLTADQTAQKLHMAASTVFRQQRQAIERLTAILNQQERQARTARLARIEQRLCDRTYTRLIGVDNQIAQLGALLREARAPVILAIEGLGGIGKTALADALARRVANDLAFVDLAWVTARQQSLNLGGAIRHERDKGVNVDEVISLIFSQLWQDEAAPVALSIEQKRQLLRQRLGQAAHLVVVDNLETIADLENLMPVIRQLADPSKFLLTSRQSLYGEPGVYHHLLPELGREHALQLVRQEAVEHNVAQVIQASDAELAPIYDTVGGNALALRLVVGQVQFHPLHRVLDGLKQARGLSVVNLYSYIYRQAWDDLDPAARQVFLAMPLLSHNQGGDVEQIAAISGLAEEVVSDALGSLITRNLVDTRGGLNERRYTIHSLTRTFLHEVARWS